MLPILGVDSAIEGLQKLSEVSHSGASTADILRVVCGLVAVVLIFGSPVIIVLAMLRQRTNRQKLVNDLALKLAEKGQPIPPELFLEPARPRSDLRRGILWAAVGLGFIMFGLVNGNTDIVGIAFIPAMIGAGFVIAALLERRQKEHEK